jgi:hypothetical protein
MYELATIVLLGLALSMVIDVVGNLGHLSRAATITLAVLLGIGLTWLLDYNVYAGWSQGFRKGWMGTVGTGFTIAGVSAVWHEIRGVLTSYAHRYAGQPGDIETRTPRAA